jgi:hypothetical protein
MTVLAERRPVHLVCDQLHQPEHLVVPHLDAAVEVAGATGNAPVVDGESPGQMSGIHVFDGYVAGMASLPEEELGLVVLPQAAALFLHVAEEAEAVNGLCRQTETIALVAILRVDLLGVAVGAFRDACLVRIEGVVGIGRRCRKQKNTDAERQQKPGCLSAGWVTAKIL